MRFKQFVLALSSAVLAASTALVARPAAPLDAAIITPAACAALKGAQIADTTIESATNVTGPTFTPAGGGGTAQSAGVLPRGGRDQTSHHFEVWLPLTTWNGKFQGVGNGGTAGVISYGALAAGIRRGYATASTDTGHVSKDSADSSWALGRPDLVADFGYRGLHVMTENGKKRRRRSTMRRRRARTALEQLTSSERVGGVGTTPSSASSRSPSSCGDRGHRSRRRGIGRPSAHDESAESLLTWPVSAVA